MANNIAFLVAFIALFSAPDICSQTLTTNEKQKVSAHVNSISKDSAFILAKHMLMVSTFYETKEGRERDADSKAISVALEVFGLIESEYSRSDEYWFFRATGFGLIKNYEQAIISYSKAIEINPKGVGYFAKRARAKMQISNHYGAIPDFSKAITLDPSDDSLFGDRAICYLVTKQFNNALVDSNKAISLNQRAGSYYLTRGLVHLNFERRKEGCLDFNTAGDLGDERAFEFLRDLCGN
jgi:tetratricopeptide (TPR) repeat protein